MANKKTVKLAGREYEIAQLTIRESKVWREKLRGPFAQLAEQLETIDQIDIQNGGDLGKLIRSFETTIIGSLELVLDLLCSYSSAIAADREVIEAEGYDNEVVDAFVEVVRLAFPLRALVKVVRG